MSTTNYSLGKQHSTRLQPQLSKAINQLDSYVRLNGWTGYDPNDIRAHPLIASLIVNRVTSAPTKAIIELFPQVTRRLLRIKPVTHPKAIALFADAYLTLYELTKEDEFRVLAEERLQWLIKNAVPGFSGTAWGFPFDFLGRDRISAGTPSVVITSIAAQALLHGYQILKIPTYLNTAISSCAFITDDLRRFEPNSEHLCFSKVPGVNWYIHNANVMAAATLAKVGTVMDSTEWDQLIIRALNYTIGEQREDGAWYYWGPPSQLNYWIDHYHTGFVLRALDDIYSTKDWDFLLDPLNIGYAYYIHNLFDDDCIPRRTDKKRYPVDIHSCAEAIICLSQLSNRYKDAANKALAVAQWTFEHMRHQSGYFYYRRYPFFTSKIPYMRRGQAWMMAALTQLQKTLPFTHINKKLIE